jgi:Protein of unknown function (DUF2911)
MKNTRKTAAFLTFLLAGVAGCAVPGQSQVASPPARAACKFSDGKSITVDYASPRMRGRKIFGDLVPYGEVWRAGANEATSFVTNTALVVGGKDVPAGGYTLFTLPTPTKWTLILSRKTGEWGIPYPGEQFDFGRMEMKVSRLPAALENFTISFDQTGASCTLKLDWETTRASIDISEKK